jgi:hypothetical protein
MFLSLNIESDQVSNNNYEDEVIEIARSNMNLVPEMEKLLRTVYRAGYNECLRNIKEKRNTSYTDSISDGGMDPR